ncbi:MAG TPA: peptide chain release factor N(5)-glutamine methyltransferase [Terriglobales bacterium]
MTLREAVSQAEAELAGCDVPSPDPRRDAETLLLCALGREGDRAHLLANPTLTIDCETASRFWDFVQQRALGKPIQYITGHQEFWGLDFLVNPDVLIPRSETEHSVEAVLSWARKQGCRNFRVVDVGTGSGAIAIALAHSLSTAEVTALDISAAALAVAQQNAVRHQVHVRFLESDLLQAVSAEKFDTVVSNPPYIGTLHPETVQRQVREFEPAVALWGGAIGLDIYERLIPQAAGVLRSGGLLVLEIGYSMDESVRSLLSPNLWRDVCSVPDLQGIPRVVIAVREEFTPEAPESR